MNVRSGIWTTSLMAALAAGCVHEWNEADISDCRAVGDNILYTQNTPVETKHPLRFQVRFHEKQLFESDYSFDVLIGPDPFTSPTPTASASFHNERGTVNLNAGYAYIAGTWPMGETTMVAASADGTTLLLQVDGTIHRVYLLKKTLFGTETATVKMPAVPGVPTKQLPAGSTEWYVETNAAGTDLLGPFDISTAPAPISNFVKRVKQYACWLKVRDACN